MVNPDLIAKVAQKLDPLGLNFAFVGGSIVELLLDRPDLSPMRPTGHRGGDGEPTLFRPGGGPSLSVRAIRT